MVKLHLSLSAAFAALALTSAEKAPGDIIQMKMVTIGQTDQIRILTKPRPGYNPANDAPSVWNMKDGCEDVSSVDFIFSDVDEESKCCKLESLDGFNLWPEQQDYTIPAGANIVAEEKFALDNGCFQRTSGSGGSNTLQAGRTYNSYMAQTLSHDKSEEFFDNVIEFHKYVFQLLYRFFDAPISHAFNLAKISLPSFTAPTSWLKPTNSLRLEDNLRTTMFAMMNGGVLKPVATNMNPCMSIVLLDQALDPVPFP